MANMNIETHNLMIDYAKSFLGVPYIYGGGSRSGLDCSGFLCEILKAFGIIEHDADFTAQGLLEFLKARSLKPFIPIGACVFFGKERATHVGLALSPNSMIEAGGGDHNTNEIEEAFAKNACVRIRPILYRKDFLDTVLF